MYFGIFKPNFIVLWIIMNVFNISGPVFRQYIPVEHNLN